MDSLTCAESQAGVTSNIRPCASAPQNASVHSRDDVSVLKVDGPLSRSAPADEHASVHDTQHDPTAVLCEYHMAIRRGADDRRDDQPVALANAEFICRSHTNHSDKDGARRDGQHSRVDPHAFRGRIEREPHASHVAHHRYCDHPGRWPRNLNAVETRPYLSNFGVKQGHRQGTGKGFGMPTQPILKIPIKHRIFLRA